MPASIPWVRRKEKSAQLRLPRGQDTPGSLGGDAGLHRHLVEQDGLGQLRLGARGGDLQQRFAREDRGALGHRPHLPAEPQLPQGRQILVPETLGVREPGQVVASEREPLQ
jgi:hypothetical protein